MARELQAEPDTPPNTRPRRRYETTKSLHYPRPDYQRPLLTLAAEVREGFVRRLTALYGEAAARQWMPELERICRVYYAHKPTGMIARERDFDPLERFSEEDVILITYGDLIRGNDPSPLATLSKFCGLQLGRTVNTLHILPFYPYSSDRGFSVVDFETVDPGLGTWQDLEAIETRYQLMFDGVINHVSSQSRWFQEFLAGNPRYRGFFTSFSAPDELTQEQRSLIFRPRTTDVLTVYPSLDGPRHVWTTFSADQIDLNYQDPEVLMRVLEILLLYVRRGADIIRLDAVTFLWIRPGTPCVHLAETHEVVKLFRDVLRVVAPHVALVTETNVPHAENVA
ncbi:MAG: sugar phosphorylase, partial [Proteobacteria bacterium]|nr:sugar phosphorylase [Pseudomonadota bacterium]